MKPGEDTLGDASQMLRDILQSKEKKLPEHIGDNNNTLKTFNADTSLKSFCAASDSDNQEMMSSLLRGKSSASSKPNSVDNDIHSDNYTNLSGDESDLDSPYGQIAPDDLHTKESDIDPDATSPAENVSTSDSKEAKRARVENILTTIRQSPQAGFDSLTQASYEMKRQKRKQLQPQQHDVKSLLAPDTKYRKMERMVLHEHIRQLQHQLKAVERSFHQICDSDEDDKDISNGREGEDDDDDGVESPANGRSYSSFMQMSGALRNKLPLTPMANGLSPRSYGREELGFTATPANLNFKPESDLSLEISIASKALKRDVQLSQNGDVPPSPAEQQPPVRVPPTLKSEIIQAVTQVLDAVLEKHVTATQQPERAAPVQQTHRQQQQQQQNHHQQQQQQQQQQQHQQHPHQQHQKKEEFRQHHQPSPLTPRSKSDRELLKEIPASYQSEKKPELIIPYTDHLNFLERFSSNRLSSEKFSAFEPLHRNDSDLCAPHSSAAMTFAPHYPYYMHAGILPQLFPVEPEQTEALPLVVSNVPKKKRTKVTDTRLSPRAKSALLQDSPGTSLPGLMDNDRHQTLHNPFPHYLSPMLPTSVAITNPSLHRSDIFSFPRFHDSMFDARMSSPPAHERSSPKSPQDSLHGMLKSDVFDSSTPEHTLDGQPNQKTCTLTPMHLRKAKLMFFYTRYPNSGILKIYFPDVSFNKNNTAQLVKWFSNFREFFYIQMEKYARQAVADGCQHAEDLVVNRDSELFRHLNLHYNRNNQIEAPETFRNVVESTLREFFRAVVSKKDTESSWKKAIYKVIARMDEPLPEFFKSANWMEQLGDV